MCFASLANKKKTFCIASDLGMRDSNRIAHRGCIARFGPLSNSQISFELWFRERKSLAQKAEVLIAVVLSWERLGPYRVGTRNRILGV